MSVDGQGSGWKPIGGGDEPLVEDSQTSLEESRPLGNQPPRQRYGSGNYPFTNRSCSQQEYSPWDTDPVRKLGWHSVYEQVGRRKLGQ